MSEVFLIQINQGSYSRLTTTHTYENNLWMNKHRDGAQGEVKPGDTVLFYCTGDVPLYYTSLACSAEVETVSDDNTLLNFNEIRWLPTRLPRDRIRQLVANGDLEDTFRSCGAQGFNIAKLQPDSFQKVCDLGGRSEGDVPTRQGPLDDVIETKLEDYIVQNWRDIDFGSRLALYQEGGDPVGQQYDTGEIGRIDLLCQDEDTGGLVIIELKRGRPSDEVIGQLARYIGWARRRLANGREVRGIILAPDFDARLRYAAEALRDVELLKYKVKFEITREDLL